MNPTTSYKLIFNFFIIKKNMVKAICVNNTQQSTMSLNLGRMEYFIIWFDS
jgi:hypothetical protein